MNRPLVIYVDVDDTLVRSFGSKRIAMTEVVEHVRELKQAGAQLIAANHPQFVIHHWKDARAMCREFEQHLPGAALICLDHDLYPPDDSTDWGDGLIFAKQLAGCDPCCPVLIHSSNSDRAMMMRGELEGRGWQCSRIAPFGSDWVEFEWAMTVRELLANV